MLFLSLESFTWFAWWTFLYMQDILECENEFSFIFLMNHEESLPFFYSLKIFSFSWWLHPDLRGISIVLMSWYLLLISLVLIFFGYILSFIYFMFILVYLLPMYDICALYKFVYLLLPKHFALHLDTRALYPGSIPYRHRRMESSVAFWNLWFTYKQIKALRLNWTLSACCQPIMGKDWEPSLTKM